MDIPKLQGKLLEELTDVEGLLQQELAEEGNKVLARENNYRFLRLLIEQPELEPREYRKSLLGKYGVNADVDVSEQLRANDLYSISKRSRLSQIMNSIGTKMCNLIMGQSSDSGADYDDIAKIILSKFFVERKVEGKLFLISLTLLPVWQETLGNPMLQSMLEKLKSIAMKGSYKLCREAARQLVYTLGIEYGLAKRRTRTERMQDILDDVISQDAEDLRSTLLIAQRELGHLREEFQEELNTLNREFINGFFTKMNSPRYGQLLDAIAQTDSLIGELQEKGWTMPPELRVIPMVIQLFMNLLRVEDVNPIEKIGDTKEVSRDEISSYEFVGSKDWTDKEKVMAIVKTPGWKIGETIISKPRIEETHR